MENRERDRVSQRASPTEAGELNRRVAEEKGRQQNSGTSAEFGQNIGRSENLEGGNMQNRKDEPMTNIGTNTGSGREVREDEPSRRGSGSSSGYGSSTGRSSGSGSMGSSDKSSDRSSDLDRSEIGSRKDSSEGRH